MSSGKEFFDEHVAYLSKGDIDGLMENHYHENAEMVTFEFVLKGREAIKQYLAVDEPSKMGDVQAMQIDEFAASDDVIIFTATVKGSKIGTFRARDALYLKDSKILRHIALTLPPDKDIVPEL